MWPLLLKYQFRLLEVDISSSDDMIEKYGTRIPVLGAGENFSELNWPFTPEQADAITADLAEEVGLPPIPMAALRHPVLR